MSRKKARLIFAMPPLEAAFHDSENNDQHELYLMCDDIASTLEELRSKNVRVAGISEQRWGKLFSFMLPGGGKIRHRNPSR
jgi:hypothetical protein